ncbi:MAG: hypothetical protein K8S23_01915 [Candidatus Cloacimonetes bacterium]|nr:hypothetical protein [Candidatus Cloacimonadota bacterium]
MKKYLFVLILFIFFAIDSGNSKEYRVKTGLQTNTWNNLLESFINRDMHLTYEPESNSLTWYVNSIAISLKDTVRVTLLDYIQKYKKWNIQASQKNVTLDKEIGDLPLTTVYFNYANDFGTDHSVKIHVKFFSQSTQRHQLVIYFDKLTSTYDEYFTNRPDDLYFWWDDVTSFEKAISDQAVKKYIYEVNKKKNIEKEFK